MTTTTTTTNNTETEAERLIAESVHRDRIVTVDHSGDVADDLAACCEDSVTTRNGTEYWGTDDDGGEWRVHLVGA
jgi:hypothetical protein